MHILHTSLQTMTICKGVAGARAGAGCVGQVFSLCFMFTCSSFCAFFVTCGFKAVSELWFSH